ncbi:MAG TPA: hypothetical protein VM122_12985 [Usitatibacter sp.]|nr:hypothetical protein [Usitatibacter sp.]
MEYQRRLNRTATTRRAAEGLGWFSIGLGLAELLFARPMARSLGMKGDEGLLRLYGVREVATGIGILASRDPTPWIWGRVAGDGLDVATLLAYFHDSPRKGNIALALAAVAGATAMDVMTAEALTEQKKPARRAVRDYSDRSGFPKGIEAVRGSAKDFMVPRDMRAALPSPEQRTHVH